MFRRITHAGLPLSSLCFALIASTTQAVAQEAPNIQVGSDTRAKSAAECMRDANFAITETGLSNFYVWSPRWRCWDPQRSGCCGCGHLSIAGLEDFHIGDRGEPKWQCSGAGS